LIETSFKEEIEEIEVASLSLHNKKEGMTKGLLVKSKDGAYSLSEIVDIERKVGYEAFNRDKFNRFYLDYLPANYKRKG
jgi:hypothetical protein